MAGLPQGPASTREVSRPADKRPHGLTARALLSYPAGALRKETVKTFAVPDKSFEDPLKPA
jgi:hypothetical protein